MRADIYLFSNGFAKSRSHAKNLIDEGSVKIDGKVIDKPSLDILETEHRVEITDTQKYVSRGGLKLEAALDAFAVNVDGMRAIDIGASTGGFTDCLLQRGVKSVVCVDSGIGQLDTRIASDERVKNIEKYNARELSRDIISDGADIAVMDVSFISQTLILPRVKDVLTENGCLISLIKPQFEAGRAAIGKGGIVKDKKDRLASILRVRDSGASVGLYMTGLIISPITGGDGNVEFLGYFKQDGSILSEEQIKKLIKQ
ncbi:MAG: TlyA family RNA methyltransferase [Ruminococcaceae bacterium]|nr:TlyA family RNA methyltransferase [Oscillospiraceae bacterium]